MNRLFSRRNIFIFKWHSLSLCRWRKLDFDNHFEFIVKFFYKHVLFCLLVLFKRLQYQYPIRWIVLSHTHQYEIVLLPVLCVKWGKQNIDIHIFFFFFLMESWWYQWCRVQTLPKFIRISLWPFFIVNVHYSYFKSSNWHNQH